MIYIVLVRHMEKDMEDTREELKQYMASKDLTIRDVARHIGRNPKTIYEFLHGKVKPHDRTLYRIRLLMEGKLQ